jgi:cytochrome c oxidase assembly factor CtaG
MSYLTTNWAHPWIAVLAFLVIVVHERGLQEINRRSTKDHAARRRRKFWFSYAGIIVLALSIVSPLEYWSMQYFWVHMLQHITVMLAAPSLYLAGAPTLPLVHAIPIRARRALLRRVFIRKRRHPLRVIGATLISPRFSIIFFNVVMVAWMLPSLFNPVMANENLHIGLMLPTFFLAGLLFWIQIVPSAPFRPRLSPIGQAGALLISNVVMIVIAISISILVSVPLYKFGSMAMPMGKITLSRFADQQIGAAILWVCGDFWCFPALIAAIRRAVKEESASDVLDRLLRRRSNMTVEEFLSADTDRFSPRR